jgi:hypothetical protein
MRFKKRLAFWRLPEKYGLRREYRFGNTISTKTDHSFFSLLKSTINFQNNIKIVVFINFVNKILFACPQTVWPREG